MKLRKLGKSGFNVSEVGLGCWQLGGDFGPVSEARSQKILDAAANSGINFWDTADVYGGGRSEALIRKYRDENGPEVFVATKVGRDAALYPDGYTKARVRINLEGSARRLGVETLDLAQLHCVPPEILKAGDLLNWMEDFQAEGLIRAFGASVETIDEALVAASHPGLASLQIIFNLFRQNAIDRLFPVAAANDVGIIVRLPLASGVLGGRMKPGQQFDPSDHRNYNRNGEFFSQGETFSGVPFDEALDFVNKLRANLPENMSMAQMAMRWILDYPAVSSVITGASRSEQVLENAGASALAPLSEELHGKFAELYRAQIEPSVVVPI